MDFKKLHKKMNPTTMMEDELKINLTYQTAFLNLKFG